MASYERDKTQTPSSRDSVTVLFEGDETPILSSSDSRSDAHTDSNSSRFTHRRKSASVRIPENYVHPSHVNISGHTGPLSARNDRQSSAIQMTSPLYATNIFEKQLALGQHNSNEPERYPSLNVRNQNELMDDNYAGKRDHLLRSGQLGMCNDPYCTTCPSYYHPQGFRKISNSSDIMDHKFRNMISGEAKSCGKRLVAYIRTYNRPVMNPHTEIIQHWNQFFVISCLFSIFVDPLFFFLLSVQQESKCIVLNQTLTTTLVVLRSCTDFVYLLHLLLQFRIAYVDPESRVVGVGELVDNPRKIARNYLHGYFWIDLFLVFPVPQIIILVILPGSNSSSGANYAKNLLRAAILVQYIPRFYRFFPFLAGQSPTGFIFESAWANFVINMLTFILTSHVVGSSWYLLGLQRVNQCLHNACHKLESDIPYCKHFMDCGYGTEDLKFFSDPTWGLWKNNSDTVACFSSDGFAYGIYVQAVNLTTVNSMVTRYVYSLFWGFQQVSTLAGNQVPSYFVWEVLFTMLIIGLGLLLFALLIGNMQNFLQSLERRRLERSLRRRDVEQWMSHRRLPLDLRTKIRQAERYNWAATRGVNEEMLMEGLPEDLQQEIRRHLFEFIKKVRIFALLDEPVLDFIRERFRQTTYIEDNRIIYPGGFVDKMVFIVRGKAKSVAENGNVELLSEGGVCGEELLTWCLEHTSVHRDTRKMKNAGHGLVSNRLVRCLTNVEAFVLRVEDIEQVTSVYARFLRNPRVQGAIRYESPYWRSLAARHIQVAWRYRSKWRNRENSSNSMLKNSSRD